MPDLSRSQLLVYGAVAVSLLFLGARWIRSDADSSGTGVDYSSAAGSGSASGGGGTGSFSVSADAGGDVVVHVAGAVRSPGVYRLPAGSRVTDAVDRAGGGASDADVNAINLAARLADGQQVVVPVKVTSGAGGVPAGSTVPSDDGPISLGSATVEDLDTIEGIGPVTAQQIIDFRDQHGGVASIDELDQVSGIGPATMDALRARLQP